jgi:hypothetical protein
MAVYFLLRTEGGDHFTSTDDEHVLDWFRRHFDDARSGDDCCDELGANVYGLMSVFAAISEAGLALPDSDAKLVALIEEHLYVEGDLVVEPHFVHATTEDDEEEIEYFFFDDVLAESAAGRDRLPEPREDDDDEDELFDDVDGDDGADDEDDDATYESFLDNLD